MATAGRHIWVWKMSRGEQIDFAKPGMNHTFLPFLSRVSELPLDHQTQATHFFPFILPSATSPLTFPFDAHPPSPASYLFPSSSRFLFSPLLPAHISHPGIVGKGPWGNADLWFKPHFPPCCGRRGRPHGIAISPARRDGLRQLQAVADSLIRVCVMSPHLTCRRCHAALQGGRLISEAMPISQAHPNST